MTRACAFLVLAGSAAWSQPVSAGLKAGVPLNSLVTAASPAFTATTHRYTLGPMVELRLPHRFGFEADLLWKRVEFGLAGTPSTMHASRWELPLLAKYRFGAPFIGVGIAFNHVTSVDAPRLAELRHRGTMGFTAGAGAEKRFGIIRVAPEIRFTHWVDRNFGVFDAPLRSNLNQAEILVGVSF